MKVIIILFYSFFKVGLFAMGGAYSFLPLLDKELVEKHHWLTKEEFLDVLGLVKLFPGAISIKFATYTGYKVAGMQGVIVANLGNLLAPIALVFLAVNIYSKYRDAAGVKSAFKTIQIVIFSMLLATAFQLVDVRHLLEFRFMAIAIAAFCLFSFTRIEPALIILSAGILGGFIFRQ